MVQIGTRNNLARATATGMVAKSVRTTVETMGNQCLWVFAGDHHFRVSSVVQDFGHAPHVLFAELGVGICSQKPKKSPTEFQASKFWALLFGEEGESISSVSL